MKYMELTEITLKMVIENKILKPETEIYADGDFHKMGIINQDGSITINIEGKEKNFEFPSGAARLFATTSVNGWKFWKLMTDDGLKELSHVRELYVKAIEKQ